MGIEKNKPLPELRFPEFDDAWEVKKGDQLFTSSRTKGREGLPIYSVTLNNGLVPRDSLDRRMENDAATEDNLSAQKGDLVYNMMRMWQGAVGLANEECMISPAYVVLRPKNDADSKFFDFNFNRSRPLYDLWAYSYGLTNDRLRLYFKDFGKIKFVVPSTKEEQQKIATFLSAIDDKLNKLRRKRELLASYNRGLIQKLFSQELRFKQDDGSDFPDWQEKTIDSLFEWIGTNNLSREKLTHKQGFVQNIHYGDIHTKFSSHFNQSSENAPFILDVDFIENISEPSYCRAGGLIIADASEDYKDIGKTIEIISVTEKSLVAGLHTYIARPKVKISLGFSGFLFQSPDLRKKIKTIAQGVSVLGVSKANLNKIKIDLPSFDEQMKITKILSAIDEKKNKTTKQIMQLETFKKGLLQK